MKKIKFLLATIVVFLIGVVFVNAQERAKITNVSISNDGIVTFDEVTDAESIWYGINGLSIPVSSTTSVLTRIQSACEEGDLVGMCATNYAGTYSFEIYTTQDGNITADYYAILTYDGNSYSLREVNRLALLVVYHTDGGSKVEWEIVPDGERAHKPNDPEKDGKIFGGWYTDEEYNNEYDFDTQVFDRVTNLYAKWNDPVSISEVNITGIEKPLDGNKPSTKNINLNTDAFTIRGANWYLEGANWDTDGPASKFVAKKRYILVIQIEVNDGYIISDDFGDDDIHTNEEYLMAEFVKEAPDFRIYYEATGIPKVTKAPTLTVKNGNNNTLNLTWTEVENAAKYAVYQSTDNKKWTKLGSVTETSYTAKDLTYGKKYYYKVKAYNDISNKTSDVVTGKTKPNKMVIDVKSVSNDYVKLNWEKVKVTGYTVYQSTNNKDWEKVKDVTVNSTLELKVKSLKANKLYYFRARAYKTVSGEKVYGSYSDVVSVRTAPAKPTVTLKLIDYQTISFDFTTSKGAEYYLGQADISEKFDSENVTNYLFVDPTSTSVNGEIGQTLYVRFKACVTSDRCSGWSTVSLKYTPKTPKISVESVKSKKVNITINSVSGAQGYKIYRSTSKNGKYETIAEITDLENLTFTDKTKSGTTYYYKVRAYAKGYDGKRTFSPYSGIKKIVSK